MLAIVEKAFRVCKGHSAIGSGETGGMKKLLLALACAAVLSAGGILIAGAFANAHDVTKGGPIDLIVDQNILQNHWIVRDENIPADSCSAVEGGISGGMHRLLRFAVSTPNIGTGDLALGDPNEHIAANDGLYEFAQCHNHFHFRHYATYRHIQDPNHGESGIRAEAGGADQPPELRAAADVGLSSKA